MLNDIKGIIKQKADFLEAAAIIFEDGSGKNLDDVIVLGEETDVPSPQEESSDDENLPKDDSTGVEDDESSEEPKGDKDDGGDEEVEDIGDLPIEDSTPIDPAEPQSDEDDLLNADIDEPPMPLPGSDLPTPIGAQTGEPINPEDDLLNVEIDLGSNTVKDVLPVPPPNANEALADGSDTQHVDSGFGGGSEGSDNFSLSESTKEKSDEFELYGVKFTVPGKVTKFIDGYDKSKLTNEIANVAKDNMITMINNSKNIKKIENEILKEEKNIGKSDDTDEIRIKRIKEYLGKSHAGKFLCTKTGKISVLQISMPYIKGIVNAWMEHEMWITSKGEVISYDAVDAYKESVEPRDQNNTSFWESFFSKPGDSFSEAITLGDEPASEPTEDPAPPTTEDPGTETPAPAPGEEESEVTSAVRDKVSEVESPTPAESGDGAKEDLLKKLGNITKNLEDAKKAVMSAIQ